MNDPYELHLAGHNHLHSRSRRNFIKTTGTAALAAGIIIPTGASGKPSVTSPAESGVKTLFESLTPEQKKTVWFPWDHLDKKNGVLRKHISNNWRITRPAIKGNFYSADQQAMIRDIFVNIVNPDWVERFDKQFKDDMGGFGKKQSIAIFGTPGKGVFEWVLTGRHGTFRCDGNSTDHVAFGGPIMYGHAASGYYEKPAHPNNVFWHQAVAANEIYEMMDGKQREKALLPIAPDEAKIDFQRKGAGIDGIPVAELSKDQKEQLQKTLALLVEPFRSNDRKETMAALNKLGGLDACHLAFYQEDDLGDDKIWDNWRLEGPAFVWHYRGAPHVHVWVHVSNSPDIALNSNNRSGALRKKEKQK